MIIQGHEALCPVSVPRSFSEYFFMLENNLGTLTGHEGSSHLVKLSLPDIFNMYSRKNNEKIPEDNLKVSLLSAPAIPSQYLMRSWKIWIL